MCPFLAPVSGGERLRALPVQWRRYAVAAAKALSEPYSSVLAMRWDEMLLALAEAQALDAEDGSGLLRQLVDLMRVEHG
jgi:hypothetical protein